MAFPLTGMTPEKLRDLASFFDVYDRMAEDYIHLILAVSKNPDHDLIRHATRARELVRGKEVQEDLRRWADELEATRRAKGPGFPPQGVDPAQWWPRQYQTSHEAALGGAPDPREDEHGAT